jgi:hypothetical protein
MREKIRSAFNNLRIAILNTKEGLMKMKTAKCSNILLIIGILVFLSIAFIPVSAQDNSKNGHIRGFIFKSDDQSPYSGAIVLLTNIKTEMVFQSNETDSRGDYQIKDIPAGEYQGTILIKDQRYKIENMNFTIRIFPEEIMVMSFSLKKSKTPFLYILGASAGTALTTAVATNFFSTQPEPQVSPTVK